MKKLSFLLILVIILSQVMAIQVGANNNDNQTEKKIVVFKQDYTDNNLKDKLLNKYGAVKGKHLSLINATAVRITPHIQTILEKDSSVLRIDEDIEINAIGKPVPKPTQTPPPQITPWGITRIEAQSVSFDDTINRVKVGVIDTGIDLGHPDLEVMGGMNAIIPNMSYNDDNGHGTHVAGIIAAVNNNFGVVGVSQKIDLYAIKVLNKKGSGSLSDVIEGLGWAVDNHIQVVNMSLGSSASNQTFEEAINKAYDRGVVMIAAAGNESTNVSYPAAFDKVMAVTATGMDNKIAYFSNYGSQVDVAAPGVSILSTYKGSTYATLSGTSMASPHVAGVAALVIMSGKGDLDRNGLSPMEVMNRIKKTSSKLTGMEDLNKYGEGLVNAYNAVTAPN